MQEHRRSDVSGHTQDTESTGEGPLSVRLADAHEARRRALRALADLDAALEEVAAAADSEGVETPVQEPPSWRERLWSCPPETRLDAERAAEACGLSRSRIYKLTSGDEIPHRKLSGGLVFVAGELRSWLRERESVEVEGRMEMDGETEYLRRAK